MQRRVNPGGKSLRQPNILQPDLLQLPSHLQAITCILATGTCKQQKSQKHVHDEKVTQSGDVEDLFAHPIRSEKPPPVKMLLWLLWTGLWEEITGPDLDQ